MKNDFDLVFEKWLIDLGYASIDFSIYRFDQSISLPEKFNKLYDICVRLWDNNEAMREFLRQFFETFDKNLYKTIEDILNKWKDDGIILDMIDGILLDGVTHKLYNFETVAKMKNYNFFKKGDSIKTTSHTNVYSGGGATYFVIEYFEFEGKKYARRVPILNDDGTQKVDENGLPVYTYTNIIIVDEGGFIELKNNLIAMFVSENGQIRLSQFGALGNMTNNASIYAQKISDYIANYSLERNKEFTFKLDGGKFRWATPVFIRSSRMSVIGDGFNSIVNCDGGLASAFTIDIPEGKSSTFTMRDLMIINPQVCLATVRASVDISISGVWFGQSDYHIKGSFVSVDISNCILEMAKKGSIDSQTATGLRKFVISNNIFYANNGFHINLVGDQQYERIHEGVISGNSFDQTLNQLGTNGGIRLAYVRDIIIGDNNVNGEVGPFSSNLLSIIGCKDLIISSFNGHETTGSLITISDSEDIYLDVSVRNSGSNGVNIARSKNLRGKIKCRSTKGHGVYFDKVTDSSFEIDVRDIEQSGLLITDCQDLYFSKMFIRECNKRNDYLYGGFVIGDETKNSERIVVSDSTCYGNGRANIRMLKGTKNCTFRDISLKTDSLETFVDESESDTNIKTNIRSFG